METKKSKDWVTNLQIHVDNLNSRQLDAIGGLRPKDLNGPQDDYKIDEANGGFINNQVDWKLGRQMQIKYENDKSKLQAGDYVFVPNKQPKKYFQKSYEKQVTANPAMGFL
jgi:hypothetical protein